MPLEEGFEEEEVEDGAGKPVSPMAAFKACLARFETEEGRLKGLAFQPKAGDVMVRACIILGMQPLYCFQSLASHFNPT